MAKAAAGHRSVAMARAMAAVRALVAIAGGYAVTALAVMGGAALLARAGVARSEAVVTAGMLGFPAYLVLLMWALACPSLRRLAAVLGGLAGACALLAWCARLGPAA